MSRKSKPIRRRLAAFLAVCMVASNLQGLGLAYGSEEIKPENANLIQLDTEKIREAAEQAVESGVLVSPPVMVATASTASNAIPFQNPAYELADASTLLAEGTVLPNKTSIRIFLEPKLETEEAEEVSEEDDSIELINDIGLEEELEDGYSLSGREQLIFLIKNEGKEAQGYQFQFGNKVTGVVVVESSNQLMEEYEMGDSEMSAGPGNETELAAPETEVQPEVPETEAQPEVSESEAAPEIPESEIQPEISESEVTPETTETEAQPEVPETEAQLETEESQEPEIQIETEVEQESGSETEPEEDIVVEVLPEADQNIEEGQAYPENLVAGILEKTAGFLTGTMTVYAAETATPSEVIVATGSNVIDTTKKEKKVFTAAADTADLAKLEIQPVNVLVEGGMEAIQVGKPKLGFFSRMFKNEAEISSVGMFALPLNAVMAVAEIEARSGENTGITLYNYGSDVDTNSVNGQNAVNAYLKGQDKNNPDMLLRFTDSSYTFKNENGRNNPDPKADVAYNYYQGYDKKGGKRNITMNIASSDGSNNEAVDFDKLFPEKSQTYNQKNAVDVYKNVNEGRFLNDEDPFFKKDNNGYYSYDSDVIHAEFDEDTKTLSRRTGGPSGFWPFSSGDGKTYYFGMEVGFDFYKPASGRFNKQPMEFSFSGDDDVWVYLTDPAGKTRLALDLGGIHGQVDGSINFETGVITYSGTQLGSGEYGNGNQPLINNVGRGEIQTPNTKDQKAYAYLYDDNPPAGYNFIDDVYPNEDDENKIGLSRSAGMWHLSFFYLERGAGESNCKLSFNLPVVPTDDIQISKEVIAESGADLSGEEYGFWLVWSEDFDQLKRYIESNETKPGPDVNKVDTQYIGVGVNEAEILETLPKGTFFYIKEATPAPNVQWDIIASTGAVEVEEENTTTDKSRSDIYEVLAEKDTYGVHIQCTNRYDGLAPKLHKRAWKNWNDDEISIYDIVLDVTGDTNNAGKGLLNPVVVDEIEKDNLEFTDKVDSADAPNLYLKQGDVTGTSEYGNRKAVSKGDLTKLTATVNGDEVTYKDRGTLVATYVSGEDKNTLTWYVATELKADGRKYEGTRSLVYEVKATGAYEDDSEDYPDQGEADTGTYKEQRGYYSNVSATLTYDQLKKEDGTQGVLIYPQPVIRPDERRFVDFTLMKEVEGTGIPNSLEFTFNLEINDKDDEVYNGEIKVNETSDTVKNGTYTLTLTAGETKTISLPEECTYTITEVSFDDGEYATMKTSIQKNGHKVDGDEATGEVVYNKEDAYVFINKVEAYKTLIVKKVVEGKTGGTYGFKLASDNTDEDKNAKILAEVIEDNDKLLNAEGEFDINVTDKEGSVELSIHPKYADDTFTITEMDTQGAWKTEVKKDNDGEFEETKEITNVKAGDTVIFKNSYFDHTITLKKEVTGYNPNPEAQYKFEVKLEGLAFGDKEKIKVGDMPASFKENSADTILVNLKVDESITISGLPKNVTEAKITEILSRDDAYNVKLDEIKIDDKSATVAENGVTVDLPNNNNASHSVTFINKYEKRMGTLQIVKELDGIDNVANAFRFKIDQMNGEKVVMTFYKTIVVPERAEKAQTEVITVPAGTYRITELDTMKYEIADVLKKVQTVEVTDTPADDGSAAVVTVTFVNHKITNQYFTDTNIAVNKVTDNGEGGFHYEKMGQPVANLPEKGSSDSGEAKALPSNKDEDDSDTV